MPNEIKTELVLIGGGHAHVHVMNAFATRPEPGVRLSLVTRELSTPYSGMLPGVIAGLYRPAEAQIDLTRLAAATGTHLVHAEATGLDRANKRILLAGCGSIAYDLVSLDIGITPALDGITGAAEHAIAVKPIGTFLTKFEGLRMRCRAPDGPRRISVIGGGAGGVELLLSLRARLIADARAAGNDAGEMTFALFTAGEILATHNRRVRDAFRRVFRERKVGLYEAFPIAAVHPGALTGPRGQEIAADAILIATGASAPAWLRGTGLRLDADGFVAVGPTLQALDDPDVFAAGDCAALIETPREKAGVFAVRAGPPLACNLRFRARKATPRAWRPQGNRLALISTGERYAVASRGWFKIEGGWVWTVKDLIDRRWMRRYQSSGMAV